MPHTGTPLYITYCPWLKRYPCRGDCNHSYTRFHLVNCQMLLSNLCLIFSHIHLLLSFLPFGISKNWIFTPSSIKGIPFHTYSASLSHITKSKGHLTKCVIHTIISGPGLIPEAYHYALEMGLITFLESTVWLDSFKKHHNIRFVTLSRKSADVPAAIVEEYQHWLSEIFKGYSLWDIFNVDESGLFYPQLQCKSLV